MAVTANQIVRRQDGLRKSYPVAATIHIYEGTMVFLTTSGYATDVIASGANVFAGIAVAEVDNSSGSSGDKEVECFYSGDFVLTGSGFSQATLGDRIYASDNYTTTASASSTSFVGRCSRYISSTSIEVCIHDRIDPSNNAVGAVADDTSIILGDSDDFQLLWSTGDASNHAAVIALGDTSNQLHITDVGAMATDWNVSASTDPEVYIHSNTTPATDYIRIGGHTGTVADIDVVGGTTLNLKIAGTAAATITSAGVNLPAGQDVTFVGTTGQNQINITTNLADALSITDASVDMLVFTTTTGAPVLSTAAKFNASTLGLRTIQAVNNVHDTVPTAAELTTSFGSVAGLGRGFIGTVDDADGDTNGYIVWASDASFYFVKGTKAA